MADGRDPLDALRRPVVPRAPRPAFAAALRHRLEEELGMSLTDENRRTEPTRIDEGGLGMVHLRVGDADRAMAFFGALFDWEAERVEFGDHVSHYVHNTTPTVRLLDDPNAPAVVPLYVVTDVGAAAGAVEGAGGRITESEVATDGGGWARGEDDQGLPLFVFRPGQYRSAALSAPPSGDVGLVFIRADAGTAERFYGTVLAWPFQRVHPDSWYFDTVARVGVFDEAAAFGTSVTPGVTLYLHVDALTPVLARVEALGGTAGPAAQDMGPYFTALCTDDQGTAFGVMSEALS